MKTNLEELKKNKSVNNCEEISGRFFVVICAEIYDGILEGFSKISDT